jgi:hypothetical protein
LYGVLGERKAQQVYNESVRNREYLKHQILDMTARKHYDKLKKIE